MGPCPIKNGGLDARATILDDCGFGGNLESDRSCKGEVYTNRSYN